MTLIEKQELLKETIEQMSDREVAEVIVWEMGDITGLLKELGKEVQREKLL